MSENRILNWKRQPKDPRDLKSVRHLAAPVSLPVSFELDRNIPVFDQGNIGSCVSNSACACFRYEAAQVQGDFRFEPSRLFVYYNARKLQGWEREDSGAYIRDGFKSLNKWGLATESTWKYDTAKFAIEPPKEAYDDALKNVTVKYAAVDQNVNTIKQTLLSGAAVSFGFNVYDSFFGSWDRTTGIMPLPKKGESLQGGHAVTITGYRDDIKCFIIQNSWGTSWGKAGKYFAPYSFVLNPNEADDFWAIEEIKLDNGEIPVPPTPSTIDWEVASTVLFKTARELYAVKKPTILRLGTALGLPVDEKRKFEFNYNLVKTKLNL